MDSEALELGAAHRSDHALAVNRSGSGPTSMRCSAGGPWQTPSCDYGNGRGLRCSLRCWFGIMGKGTGRVLVVVPDTRMTALPLAFITPRGHYKGSLPQVKRGSGPPSLTTNTSSIQQRSFWSPGHRRWAAITMPSSSLQLGSAPSSANANTSV